MCSESRDQEQENLERWRCGLEKRGRVVTRPAVMYGSEKVVLKKRFRTDSVKIFIQSDEDREDYSWLYIYMETELENQWSNWDGLDTCRGEMDDILGKGCWIWSSLAGGKEEDHREEDAWISWDGPLWQAQHVDTPFGVINHICATWSCRYLLIPPLNC